MRSVIIVLLVLPMILTLSHFSAMANNMHIPLQNSKKKENKALLTNDLMKAYLDMSSMRHKILSENVANVNTAGYKANEIAAPSHYKDLDPKSNFPKKVRVNTTANNHLIGKNKEQGQFSSHKLKDPYETKPNGNNVSLHQQTLLLSQNKQDYNLALKNYAVINSLISSALGK